MPIAIDPTQTVEYVLEAERNGDGAPKDGATVFLLRPLTARQFARSMQVHGAGGVGAAAIECVRHGLAGVRGLADGRGGTVEFAVRNGLFGDEVTDAFLDRLSIRWIMELSGAIADLNQVTEDEEKN